MFSARMAAVNYMFDRRGRVTVSVSKSSATVHVDKIFDLGIENGAVELNELVEEGDSHVMEVKMDSFA